MKSKNAYLLPVPEKAIQKEVWGESKEAPAHINGKDMHPAFGDEKNAVDFYCSEGTKIYAAYDGEVILVKGDSKEGGRDPKYASIANSITIRHKNGEYTNYLHMKYKGVFVKKGDKVSKGDVIGLVGTTGWTPASHLHFSVFKITGKNPFVDYKTLQFKLENYAASW